MLYHASKIQGLSVLMPHKSTGRKAYVYAINNKTSALCFGAPKDDFDLLMDEADGVTVLKECYPRALEKVYSGKQCSLYTVDDELFASGITGWDAEFVSEKPVKVVSEERIPDILAYLLRAVEQGNCIVQRYTEDEAYLSMLRDEIQGRIAAFHLTEAQIRQDYRFEYYFKNFLEK